MQKQMKIQLKSLSLHLMSTKDPYRNSLILTKFTGATFPGKLIKSSLILKLIQKNEKF